MYPHFVNPIPSWCSFSDFRLCMEISHCSADLTYPDPHSLGCPYYNHWSSTKSVFPLSWNTLSVQMASCGSCGILIPAIAKTSILPFSCLHQQTFSISRPAESHSHSNSLTPLLVDGCLPCLTNSPSLDHHSLWCGHATERRPKYVRSCSRTCFECLSIACCHEFFAKAL